MLPFCELFLGFSKSNPTVITGQSVSAGRPRSNKNATYFIKMVCEFVCNVCGKQFMTKNALYDHNWGVHTEVESPCSDCDKIFRNKTKLAYHIKTTHQEKESFYCDVKSGEIQCIYYSATKSNLRTHKKRVHEKTLLNLCAVRVTTELTPSLTWTDIVRSAKLWIQVPSITLATCATRRFLQRRT